MPFSDAVDLFNYWAEFPPTHLMVRGYLGYDGTGKKQQNPIEVAEAMRAITGSRRAPKLASAPKEVREKFEAMKEQALKDKAKKKHAG